MSFERAKAKVTYEKIRRTSHTRIKKIIYRNTFSINGSNDFYEGAFFHPKKRTHRTTKVENRIKKSVKGRKLSR